MFLACLIGSTSLGALTACALLAWGGRKKVRRRDEDSYWKRKGWME